ncbi:T9SS sorting signal type C domain-containing protein [Flavobacterium endoglycinae]|uniref:T9SS sorting signal type C domain-containing protein n=1 Tax=Flavobacterium endoglycinae TaxID=2816357 RepID=UPI001EF0D103|nr:T9SS sorting signal type C domain-containing protein [Flavobacterium endoglycinae]
MIKKILLTSLIALLFYNNCLYAQQGKIDITFNTLDDGLKGDGFNDVVRALYLQPDENLLVGGDYLSLNGSSVSYLTRLKPDGTIDENFNTGTGFNGKIYAINVQPDGKIIAAGNFTAYNGNSAGRIIRLNNDGTQDLSFNTSIGAPTGIIYNISLQSDGKIIIVGSFTKYNTKTVNRIARILPDGTLDPFFDTGTGSTLNITNSRILSDGKILLTGNFTLFNKIESNRIIRLNTDGSVDTNFNIGTGFNDDVNAIVIQPDGKIILGGNFTSYQENTANRIIRINQDGSVDTEFLGTGFNSGNVEIIKTDTQGNIMVGGNFTSKYNGTDVNRVILLDSKGLLKTDFDIGLGPASASVFALANDQEGSWFIGGSFSVFDGQNQGRLAKVNFEGEQDSSYLSSGIGFNNSVFKIIPQENKKTIVVGNFITFNNNPAPRIARLLEDGSSDPDFNKEQTGANNLIKSAILQADGKIIIGGNFTKYNDVLCNRLARILPDGSFDPTFNIGSGFNNQIYAMAIQSDGKIIVAGNFTRFNNDSSVERILRLLPDGSRDFTFNARIEAIIDDVLVQPDGKILVAGRFNGHLVRLSSDGSIDPDFNIGVYGFDKNVYAIALQSDNKILVGGFFLSFNGQSQKKISRLNPNGSLDTSFDSGTGFNKGDVRAFLIQPDGRILVGGSFSGTYKNTSALRLIRLMKNGDLDPSFTVTLNNKLYTFGLTYNHRLLIGGDFNSVSGVSKHRIARLKLCLDSTTWDGISWSNGYPSGGKEIFFKGDFPALVSSDVCSCNIDSGKEVTIPSGQTLSIEFSYSGEGILNLEDSASLYQSDDDIKNTGIIHLKRNTKPILKFDYTYWSAPVQNQKLIDVSPNTLYDKYFSYNPVSGWQFENPYFDMISGKGYIIRGPQEFSTSTASTYKAIFKGIPNNGKIDVNMGAADSFNLIGNPYASAIDADVFLKKNEFKTKGTLYFWTHNTPITNYEYTADDYAVYNLVGGIGTKANSDGINETIPNGKIASGQSFFIKSNAAGTIEFNDGMRIPNQNNAFFKPSENKNLVKDEIEKHRFWLNLRNDKGAFKQLLAGYVTGATNNYDINYDGEILEGNQFVDFYSIVENKKLAIQGRGLPFEDTDQIILGYKTTISGEFTIGIDHTDGIFVDQDIYLEDKLNQNWQNLQSGDYAFTSPIGTFEDRFVLHYKYQTLGDKKIETHKNDILVSSKHKIININSLNVNLKAVDIFDTRGRLIYSKKKIGKSDLEISNLNAADQVLLLKITLENEYSEVKKIIF